MKLPTPPLQKEVITDGTSKALLVSPGSPKFAFSFRSYSLHDQSFQSLFSTWSIMQTPEIDDT